MGTKETTVGIRQEIRCAAAGTEWGAGTPEEVRKKIYRRALSLNSLLLFRNSHLSPCKFLFWRFTRHCNAALHFNALRMRTGPNISTLQYFEFGHSLCLAICGWTSKDSEEGTQGGVTSSRTTILRFTSHQTNIVIIDLWSRPPVRVISALL